MASDAMLLDARIGLTVDCTACGGSGRTIGPVDESERPADAPDDYTDEIDCHACDGTGARTSVVTLETILRHFLDHVPRSVLPRQELEAAIENVQKALTRAASQVGSNTVRGQVQTQEALRTVTEAAHSLRELAELLR